MERNVTDPQLLHPRYNALSGLHRRITAKPVDASKAAEAYALSYWIANINGYTNRIDLQRSLLLDPTWPLARVVF